MRAGLGRGEAILLGLIVVTSCVLVKQSHPRVDGDGGEYVAMAWQLSRLQPPALSPADMARYRSHILAQPEIDYLGRGSPSCCIYRHPPFESHGRYDLAHFWMYSLFAVPFMWVTRLLHFSDTYAFFGLHLVLLSLVAVVVSRKTNPWVAAVVVLSPMLYWLDKPHTEIFVFVAIACAMCWWDDKPVAGSLALALAGSQNLALAPLLPVYVLAVLLRKGRGWLSRQTVAGLAGAAAIVLLHPLYYMVRIGAVDPQSLLEQQRFRIPTATKLLTPLLDPYLGLLTWWPGILALLAVASAVGIHEALRRRWRPSVHSFVLPAAIAVMSLAALFGAAQNLNSNHGATFGMSRYATWMAPLALPAFIGLQRWSTAWSRYALIGVTAASAVLSVIVARPSIPDVPSIFRPTYVSRLVFRFAPTLYDPVPEVFIERETGVATDDKLGLPAGNRSCSKVLVYRGQWPPTCPLPTLVPRRCTNARFCYGSRQGGTYRYSTVDELS